MSGLTFNIFGHDVSASKKIKDVEGQAKKSSGTIGSSFAKMGGVIAGGFAGAGVVDFFKDSVQGYQDHLTALKQTAQVIKTTGGVANVTAASAGNLSDTIEAMTGVDGDAVLAGENMLLTFTNIHNQVGKGNDIFDQATKITTDMSAALGTDLKGQAIQVGKALNDPIKGVSALSKVGVSFTDQQKAQIKTLVESGNTLGAQKVILGELGKEFGGTAAKIETPSQKMAVQFHALQDQIGAMLLPLLQKLMQFVTTTLIPAIAKMATWIGTNLVPAMKKLGEWVGKNSAWLKPLGVAILVIIAALKAWAIVQAALDALFMANPIGLVVAAVAALAVGLIYAYKHSETFRKIVQTTFQAIAAAARFMWNNVIHPILRLWMGEFQVVRVVVTAVAGAIKTAWGGMSSGLSAVWSVIHRVFGWIKSGIAGVRDFVRPVVKAVSDIFGGIGKGLKSAWDHTIGWVLRQMKSTIDTIKQGLEDIGVLAINGQGSWAPGALAAHGAAAGANAAAGSGRAGSRPIDGRLGMNAQGTGFWRGGPTVLGEFGPEIVDAPRGSRISTASMTRSARRGDGQSPTVELHFHGILPDQASVQRAVAGALEQHVGRGGSVRISKGLR